MNRITVDQMPIPKSMQDEVNEKYQAGMDLAERLTEALGIGIVATVHANLYDPPRLTFSFKEEDAHKLFTSMSAKTRYANASVLSNQQILDELRDRLGGL